MTARSLAALVVGILGSVAIAWFAHWGGVVTRPPGAEQIVAISLPPIVIFLLFMLALVWNPLVGRLAPALSFGLREMVAVASMWLFSSVLSFSGGVPMLLHTIGSLNSPTLHTPLLERAGFFERTGFGKFLPAKEAKDYDFGIGSAEGDLAFGAVPWEAWVGPLTFWLPLFFLAIILAVSLVAMCHRQWSEHERLSYPIAEVVGSLLQIEKGRPFPGIFYNRVFWSGFALISAIMLTNGLSAWFPLFLKFPLSYSQLDLVKNFPFLADFCGQEAYSLFRGFFYPLVIALVVLLPMEISLTCWAGWILMVLGTGVHFLITSRTMGPTETGVTQFGMYWAVAAMMLFVGRSYYLRVLRLALTFQRAQEVELRGAVISCRIFLASCVLLVGVLTAFGVPLPAAVVICATFALVVLLVARVTAEIGIPWLVNFGGMSTLLPLHFLGNAAASAQGIAVLAVLSVILGKSMTYSPAAQTTTVAQVGGTVPPRRLVALIAAACVAAVAASVVTTLWTNYADGAQRESTFRSGLRGSLEDAGARTERLSSAGADSGGAIQPVPKFWGYFLGGAAFVFLFAGLRLRFAWWPFHPLPLLFFNTWLMSRLYVSFLVGWLIKVAIIKLAGGNFYLKSKPFFFGVILGQLFWVFAWVLAGAVYFLVTGRQAPATNLLF
jgi:hypothetical protein